MIYDMKQIYFDFTEENLNKGKQLYLKKKVTLQTVNGSYSHYDGEPVYEILANVELSGRKTGQVTFWFENGRITNSTCGCRKRYENPYYYSSCRDRCSHMAAALFAVMDYIQEHPEKILPSRSLVELLDIYKKNAIAQKKASISGQLELEPILETELGRFSISFKIGSKKKFVVKNLYEFSEAFAKGSTLVYGKNFEVVHHLDAFTKKSQKLIQFIRGKMEENSTMVEEMRVKYYVRMPAKRSITLTPGIMDEFFEMMGEVCITWNDKEELERKKAKKTMEFVKQNPVVEVNVDPFNPSNLFSRNKGAGNNGFRGIQVSINVMGVVEGNAHTYVQIGNRLYQCNEDFKFKMEPFLELMTAENNYLAIGANEVGSFYRLVLEKLKPHIRLNEYDSDEIIQQLLPEPEFFFYLDRQDENVTCEAKVTYGEQVFPIIKGLGSSSQIADAAKEMGVSVTVEHWFPEFDLEKYLFHCGGDEDAVYELLDTGLDELMNLGTVYISDGLKQLKLKPAPKISVGVTVKSNLLDLSIRTEDFDFSELKEVLKSYRMKKHFHRLKNGDFLKLEDNSMAVLMDMMETMHLSAKDFTKGQLKLPAFRALYLDKMLQESEGINYDCDRKMKTMLRDFKSVEDSDYEVPSELDNTLRNYQKSGYQWLRTIEAYHFGGILADDMGLGKTLQMIAVLLAAKQDGKVGTSFIVCPSSLVYNWENEFHKFAPSMRVKVLTGTASVRSSLLEDLEETDVIVTSYDLLKRDIEYYENITFLYHIIDEAQYIKNPVTQAAKAVKLVKSSTRFALTGTPIENRLSELWSIFDFLMPGFLYKYEQFKKEMESPIIKNSDERIVLRLKKMVAPFILRRLKKDVLKDLPDKLEQVTYAKMEPDQRKIYEAYVEKVRQELDGQSEEEFHSGKLKILAELTRLRQLCCAPSLVYSNYEKESGKMETCMELLHNAVDGNHKVLLFSQFTSMLAIIEERLKAENISYYVITGQTKKEKRIQLVNQFNEDDTTVFLISLKAGGTGLNLTGADIVIHYDPWWNVAVQNQATDRAHRIGQTNVVTVFQLIAQDSIEEKIVQMQQAKKDLAEQIISEDTNQLQSMTREDLEELLKW